MKGQSRKIALCGVLCALAVVILLLGGLLAVAIYCAPLLAMAVLLPVLEEYGPKAAAITYAAAAILGLLLVPETELAMVYAAFGWYPILRPRLDRLLPSRPLRMLVKLALSTAVILLLYGVLLRLLGMTADLLGASSLFNLTLLVMGDVIFLLTDRALERLAVLWHRNLRKRFFR